MFQESKHDLHNALSQKKARVVTSFRKETLDEAETRKMTDFSCSGGDERGSGAVAKPWESRSEDLDQQRSCLRQQYVNQVELSYAAGINSPPNTTGLSNKSLFIVHAT